jgi:hypothetical protein
VQFVFSCCLTLRGDHIGGATAAKSHEDVRPIGGGFIRENKHCRRISLVIYRDIVENEEAKVAFRENAFGFRGRVLRGAGGAMLKSSRRTWAGLVFGLSLLLSVRASFADTTQIAAGGSNYAAYAAPGQATPDVSWTGQDSSNNPNIFSKVAGGVVITIIGQNFSTTPVGAIAEKNGVIAFRGIDSAGTNNGVYSAAAGGSLPITIYGSNFNDVSGAPSINNSGTVTFKDVFNGKTSLIIAPPNNGIVGTIHGDAFSQVSRPSINNGGDVAFVATPLGASDANAYVQPSGGGALITITGSGFKFASQQPKIIDNNKGLLVNGVDSANNNDLEFGTFNAATSSYSFTTVDSNSAGIVYDDSINSDGDILTSDGTSLRLLKPGSTKFGTATFVFSVGDAFAGSTITSLSISDSAMLDNGNIVFHATLANGTSGLFYDTVPEPATLAMVPIGLLILARRRRRAISRPSAA